MSGRVLVDGIAGTGVAADDRGLGYGDGLFETVLWVGGEAPLWSRHMQRLAEGCGRLGLPLPDPAQLHADSRQATDGLARAVVRITWTRGRGPRGYAPPRPAMPTRIVAAAPAPLRPGDWSARGIRVRFCDTRLGIQPRLAGLKHLNRLEQVLARAEWQDPAVAEGLMRDLDGHVVCATAANLFAVVDGEPATPAVDRCGVAGVARAEILERLPACRVRTIDTETLMRADEVFLSSSVRGIVPVGDLDGRTLVVGPVARALGAHFAALGFDA